MLHDVFICHASQDKDAIVRPLARELVANHVAVWFDEFELQLGDSLRETIDRGLNESRYGVVVLSPAFFERRWPQSELDGLFARESAAGERVILPIWHNVDALTVAGFSPILAGRFAASTDEGLDRVLDAILRVIRPRPSPLIVARDTLRQLGVTPPVVTDEYWLDVVAASYRVPAYGPVVPTESMWGRWTFPLPTPDGGQEERGRHLAWTALQLAWTARAEALRIDLCSHPQAILEFIDQCPGLRDTCETYPDLVAEYAPQLTIPGFGGSLEEVFDSAYAEARTGKGHYADSWTLRDPTWFGRDAYGVAYEYFSAGMFGPEVRLHDGADYLFWLLSSDSAWLPEPLRSTLRTGMCQMSSIWLWHSGHLDPEDAWPDRGAVSDCLLESRSNRWTSAIANDVAGRARIAVDRLRLADPLDQLVASFRQHGVIATARAHKLAISRRRRHRA